MISYGTDNSAERKWGENMKLTSERVGYWYFRLNGFFTIPNLVVHPDQAGNQNTDADLLGVRFPYRTELLHDPMRDDEVLTDMTDGILVVLTEVKKGLCKINRSLQDPALLNVQRLLRAIGIHPTNEINEIANEIYSHGYFTSDLYHITFCCIGHSRNSGLLETYPCVPQILWKHVFRFIYDRFARHRSRKANHPQWDMSGKLLWNAAAHLPFPEFVTFIERLWNISESI